MLQNIKQKMILFPLSLFYNFITGTREPTSADLFQFQVSVVFFPKSGRSCNLKFVRVR